MHFYIVSMVTAQDGGDVKIVELPRPEYLQNYWFKLYHILQNNTQ